MPKRRELARKPDQAPEKSGENQARDEKGRFRAGYSGNPTGEGAGRPKGALSLTSILKDVLSEDDELLAKVFVRAMVKNACMGNAMAMKIIVERVDGKDLVSALGGSAEPEEDKAFGNLHETLMRAAEATRDAMLKNQQTNPGSQSTYTGDGEIDS